MKFGYYENVPEEKPALAGAESTIRWLIGSKEGASNFAMRVIEIKRKGEKIPRHRHDYEHETFVISGKGRIAGKDVSVDVMFGDYAYIEPGEEHGFENTGDEPFRFICVIPIRDDN